MDGDDRMIRNGAVAVKGNSIVAVGYHGRHPRRAYTAERVMDARSRALCRG